MKTDAMNEVCEAGTQPRRGVKALWAIAVIALLAAMFVRVAPLIEGGERLRWQCISEDGYLMLTVARNFALGHGFSISDGTIPTNGVQPLATLLFAGCYWLAGGDRITGLYPVVGLQVLLSMVTACLVYVLTRRVFYRGPHARAVAAVAAIIWFVSPSSVMHSQNGLETGLCAALILLSVGLYDVFLPRLLESPGRSHCVLLGFVLGLTFLGRNDACFLIAALLLVHLAIGYRRRCFKECFGQAFLIGAVSVVVSLPWLWFNVSRFGHVVPVSGRAEALHVDFAHNLSAAFPAMVENLLLVARLPGALQDHRITVAVAGVLLLVITVAALIFRRWLSVRLSPGMGVLTAFVVLLFIYYALLFGMPSFLGRYFFPVVTLASVVAAAILPSILTTARGVASVRWSTALAMAAAVLSIGLNARIYAKGREHLHEQVVQWVDENVPEGTWVGAVQTGTLGYYHDRTINLDGKVDPNALAARRDKRIPQYAVDRGVTFIVDWVGIADEWTNLPVIREHYELLLEDRDRNLAVLGLRGIASPGASKRPTGTP